MSSKSIEEILNIVIATCKQQAEHIGKLQNLLVRQQEMIDQTAQTLISINTRVLRIEADIASVPALYRSDGSRILGRAH